MQNIDKPALIASLGALRAALESEPPTPVVIQALHQCERLHHAVLQSHSEGLRFAAFTLSRLMQQPGANLGEPTRTAARALQEGLNAAGYTA
jgi:hypothetical protein